MSANLVDGKSPILSNGATYIDGVYTFQANEKSESRSVIDILITDTSVLADNQTCHFGYSVKVASGASYSGYPAVRYVDAAGNVNYAGKTVTATGTGDWQRVETSFVVPSGMRINDCFLIQNGNQPITYVTGIVLSYGTSGPILASDSHTPYATQDHLKAVYATSADLKVWEDAITSEVSERTKLGGRVGTLESTSSDHTTKITQLSSSIESMVKGEATYTAPDGTTKTNGLYSKITQTADGINETFGQYTKTTDMQSQISAAQSAATSAANSATDSKLSNYTKTADLASTAAVRDAKKAGTDAASAASAAQSTANTAKANAATAQTTANTAVTNASTAQSTADAAKTAAANAQSAADAAKGTADNLATLIRKDSTGVTVGYTTDGTTFTQGRTHMGQSSFDVIDSDGNVAASLAKNRVDLLHGLTSLSASEKTYGTGESETETTLAADYPIIKGENHADLLSESSVLNGTQYTDTSSGIESGAYNVESKVSDAWATLFAEKATYTGTDKQNYKAQYAGITAKPDGMHISGAFNVYDGMRVGPATTLNGDIVSNGTLARGFWFGTATLVLNGTMTPWISSATFKNLTGVESNQQNSAIFICSGDWNARSEPMQAGWQNGGWNLYVTGGTKGARVRFNYMIVVWQ